MPTKVKVRRAVKAVKKKKAAPPDSTHLQLYFANSQMVEIRQFANNENTRRKLAGRDNIVHAYIAIPMLVDHGLAFTNHEVYVPKDKFEQLMKDKVFRDEYNTMANAMKAFGRMLSGRLSD